MAMKLFGLLMYIYSAESLKCQVQVIDTNYYVGCFIDTRSRLLPHHYKLNGGNPPDMDNNKCLLYCKEHGYMYSGTQIGKQCFCGDDPYQYGPEDVSEEYIRDYICDRHCGGDSEQICGGGWRLSVYKTGYISLTQGKVQYKLISNGTIITASANQVMTSSSKIDCALYCKISDSCKVFVISTETRECSLYSSYTVMCEEIEHVQGFQVYMME